MLIKSNSEGTNTYSNITFIIITIAIINKKQKKKKKKAISFLKLFEALTN